MPELTSPAVTDVAASLEAVAAFGLAGSRRAYPCAPLDDRTWHDFLQAVARERLAGLLGAAAGAGAFPATEPQMEQAASLHAEVSAVALLLERLLLQIAERFDAAGVDFRVLKGPAVAHLDYPEPAWRAFGDLDLIVRAGDFAKAVEVLEASGGRRDVPELRRGFDERFGKGAVITMPGNLEVDLHRSFVAGPLGMTIDLDRLFETSTPFTVGDRELPGLGTTERFVHACISAGLGRPVGLHALRDVAQVGLRPDLDLQRVRQLAASWRASAVVARAMNLAWTTFDLADAIALSAWAEAFRLDRGDRRLLDAYLGGDQSYTRQALATLRVIPRTRDRVAYARSLLFPARRYLEARSNTRLGHVRRGSAHLRWGVSR